MSLLRLLFPLLLSSGAVVAAAQPLKINEILAANSNILADPAGEFDDWVEICNPGPDAVQLAGFFLSDQAGFPTKWLIPLADPAATLIPPQGFLLLWLDGQPAQGPVHAPFKLDAAGESLWLTAPDGVTLLDSVEFGPQSQNVSLGRLPDALGDWVLLATPTPSSSNTAIAQLPVCGAPLASVDGGYFTKPFPLAFVSDIPDGQIRLSFDGSLPDENDSLYTQPIDIQQTTVVRARCFATGFLPGQATTNTYFFTPPPTFPALSLVFNPAAFFDSTSGIYTNWMTMAEIERPLHAEWFEPDGTRGFSLDLGVELFGSGSLAMPQKSLLLKAKSGFGAHEIEYPVFADLPYDKYRRLVLRNSGQDWCVSQFRDALVTDLVRHAADLAPVLDRTHLTVQGFQPAIVYFNGAYQGIFNVREHLGEEFLRHHFELDGDQADLIDFYGNALTGDSIAWFEFWNWLNTNHFDDEQNFDLLRQKTDLDNFADYCILEIISDNVDWPTKNWRRMRPRTPDGRWYWLPYDFDLSFGLFSLDGQWNSGFAGQNAFARAIDS
ncbi:MAG TPA: CotH kinase family protein, partial [Saprospiraceae bacterium]|nr:CotH kinase family protein [Saprospiraceae bacterium]